MKQKLFLLVIGCAFICYSHAQTGNAPKNEDEISFLRYTVRLVKLKDGGLGYDILRQNILLYHQLKNPYTGSTAGLRNKEDAFKTAKWQIIHITPGNDRIEARIQTTSSKEQTIPIEVAHQLNIHP